MHLAWLLIAQGHTLNVRLCARNAHTLTLNIPRTQASKYYITLTLLSSRGKTLCNAASEEMRLLQAFVSVRDPTRLAQQS